MAKLLAIAALHVQGPPTWGEGKGGIRASSPCMGSNAFLDCDGILESSVYVIDHGLCNKTDHSTDTLLALILTRFARLSWLEACHSFYLQKRGRRWI